MLLVLCLFNVILMVLMLYDIHVLLYCNEIRNLAFGHDVILIKMNENEGGYFHTCILIPYMFPFVVFPLLGIPQPIALLCTSEGAVHVEWRFENIRGAGRYGEMHTLLGFLPEIHRLQ